MMIEATVRNARIAWRNGSVPEVIADIAVLVLSWTAWPEAVEAVSHVAWLDRTTCRRAFEERFEARGWRGTM